MVNSDESAVESIGDTLTIRKNPAVVAKKIADPLGESLPNRRRATVRDGRGGGGQENAGLNGARRNRAPISNSK